MTETPTDPTVPVQAPHDAEITAALDRAQAVRAIEALLFAAGAPMDEAALARHLPAGTDVAQALADLAQHYANRGVHLVTIAGKAQFRTAPDLAHVLKLERESPRKLSRAAIETLAIIAYHQPVTRAEIEDIRGVVISRGTLDTLMEAGWIEPKGHRETPGRPATWVATERFLSDFGLASRDDLPGLEDLRAAGLLDARPAVGVYGEHAAPEPERNEDEEANAEESDEDGPAGPAA